MSEAKADIPHSKSTFKQQKLYSCRLFINPLTSAIFYFSLSIISLAIGISYISTSKDVWEKEIRYDDICDGKETCNVKLVIDKDRDESELFLYYKLTNFFHSNYMYTSSKNWDQLEGKYETGKKLDRCKPVQSIDGSILAPCGALPSSVFNDTFDIDSNLAIFEKSGISAPKSKDIFKKTNEKYSSPGAWLSNNEIFPDGQTDERFINWIQTAAFPEFRKLWGRTNKKIKLNKGEYDIIIHNNFPVSSFKGKKYIVFSETFWSGGSNNFLGYFFMALFGITLLIGIIVTVLYVTNSFPLYRHIKTLNELF
ncbi:hypothetical protein M9Y10_045891 [Tritrichomonas musculus]|uniref:Cell cycle control protein n=1 Tax=Tritrichomonas musculus TaxID=1915356 RepID=A0ABR2JWM2_9EUKA